VDFFFIANFLSVFSDEDGILPERLSGCHAFFCQEFRGKPLEGTTRQTILLREKFIVYQKTSNTEHQHRTSKFFMPLQLSVECSMFSSLRIAGRFCETLASCGFHLPLAREELTRELSLG